MVCEFREQGTQEPKIFYKTDKGVVFENLTVAMRNSGSFIEAGIKDNNGKFKPNQKITMPTYKVGKGKNAFINTAIKNGYLLADQYKDGTYSAVDHQAAYEIENNLVLDEDIYFERDGLNFKIIDLSFKDIVDDLLDIGEEGIAIAGTAARNYFKPSKEKSLGEQQLTDKLNSFLEEAGISLESLELYRSKYQIRKGLDTNAGVFIDLVNKVIVTANGEISSDVLTEEVSHFILENLPNTAVQEMMEYVPYTDMYAQHSERYRELYSRQLDNASEVEEGVRREILGKLLRDSILEEYGVTENSQGQSILNKLIKLVTNFFTKVTSNYRQDKLNSLMKDLAVKFREDSIQAEMTGEYSPLLQYMYNVEEEFRNYMTSSGNTIGNADGAKGLLDQFTYLMQITQNKLTSAKSLAQNDNIEYDDIAYMEDALRSFEDINVMLSSMPDLVRQAVMDDYSILEEHKYAYFANKMQKMSTLRDNLVGTSADVKRRLSDKKSDNIYAHTRKVALQLTGDETKADKIVEFATKVINDASKFVSGFLPVNKLQEPLINLLYSLVVKADVKARRDAQRLGMPIINDMYSRGVDTSQFINNEFFRSGVDLSARHTEKMRWEKDVVLTPVVNRYLAMQKSSEFNGEPMEESEELAELEQRFKNTTENEDEYYRWSKDFFKYIEANHKPLYYMYRYQERLKYKEFSYHIPSRADNYNRDLQLIERAYLNDGRKYTTQEQERRREVLLDSLATGSNMLFNTKIDMMTLNSRGKTRNIKVENKKLASAENKLNQSIVDPYLSDGSLRRGLKLKRRGEVEGKEEFVGKYFEMNPNIKNKSEDDFVVVMEYDLQEMLMLEPDTAKAVLLNRYNKELSEYSDDPNAKDTMYDNLLYDFKRFTKGWDRNNLTDEQKELLEDYIEDNLNFTMSDEYYDSVSYDKFNQDIFNHVLRNTQEYKDLKDAFAEIEEIDLRQSQIKKIYRDPKDFREFDLSSMTQAHRESLQELSDRRFEIVSTVIKPIYASHGMKDVYADFTMIKGMNNYFKTAFEDKVKQPFDRDFAFNTEVGLDTIKGFVSNHGVTYTGSLLKGVSKNIQKGEIHEVERTALQLLPIDTSQLLADLEKGGDVAKLAAEENANLIKSAVLLNHLSSLYHRFDVNKSIADFYLDVNSNPVKVFDIMDRLERQNEAFKAGKEDTRGRLLNRGKEVEFLIVEPAFHFDVLNNTDINTLYDTYKSLGTSREEMLAKVSLLREMAGLTASEGSVQGISPNITIDKFEEGFSDQQLKDYLSYMDLHLVSLTNYGKLETESIFLRPQQRRTGTEKVANLFTKGNTGAQLSDIWKDAVNWRNDEFVDNYMFKQMPQYGTYKLPATEITSDLNHSMLWMLEESFLYKEKKKIALDAFKLVEQIGKKTYAGGKKGINSNYYEIANEFIDYNFYGKKINGKMTVKLSNGKTVDFSKVFVNFRDLAVGFMLKFSPFIGITNYGGGQVLKYAMKRAGLDLYAPAHNRAKKELLKLLPSSLGEAEKPIINNKLSKLLMNWGLDDMSDRYRDSQYSRALRLANSAGYASMAVTNKMMHSEILLMKLMEMRLIDHRVYTFQDYKLKRLSEDSNLTTRQIKGEFESHGDKTVFDFTDEDGYIDFEAMRNLPDKAHNLTDMVDSKGAIEIDIEDAINTKIRNEIMRSIEKVTLESDHIAAGHLTRDPIWSWVLSVKKWLITATTSAFGRERMTVNGMEKGWARSMGSATVDFIKQLTSENKSLAEAWNSLDEVDQKNMKYMMWIQLMLAASMALAVMMKGYADDDDDEENWFLQFATLVAIRNVNEVFSSSLGLPNAFYESAASPVATQSSLTNLARLLKVWDMGKTIEDGKYKGRDAYWNNWVRATWLRNMDNLSDAKMLKETRTSYEHFSRQGSAYSILDLMDYFDENKKEEKVK